MRAFYWPCDGKGPPREGVPTLDADRLDLNGIDLTGLSREDVLAALTDAAIEAYEDAAEFAWDESKHPRGQPANRGQFGPGGGGASKAERSAARVERKRTEKASARQESGVARHLNNLLRERTYDINQAHAHLPEDVPTPALDRAIAALSPSTHGRDLGEKLAAFERVRDEAEREGRLTGALQRLVPRHQESEMLGHLETIRRHAESAAAAVRLEMQAREATRALDGRRAAVFSAAMEAAEFYSPDQPRDWRGRWTSGGGEGAAPVPTHAERGQLRQASLQAVRDYVRAGGEPSRVENEQLAAHLARLTVDQLHAVKAEHGLKASAKDKAALVSKLAGRFRAHRQTQEPAGAKALKEAVAGKPGFHNVREVVGGHAVTHGPTGSQVRADHAGTRFDVLTSGSTLHSSHATAAEAVKAAETSDRFGAGQSTAEQESRARHEAIANAQKRAAEKSGGLASDPHAFSAAVTETAKALPNTAGHPHDPSTAGYTGHKVYISDVYDRLAPRLGGMTLDEFKRRLLEGHLAGRLGLLRDDIMATQSRENAAKSVRSEVGHLNATFHTVDANAKTSGSLRPPAAAPPAPAGGGKAGAFDPDAAGQSLRATVERHLETLRAAGGGLSRTSPRLTAAYKAVSVEAEAAVREVVSRAPTAAALRAVARAYGIPALRGKDKESLAAELERAVRSRLQSFIRIHASYEGRRAGFSVAGALSPDEAEERAARRLVEAYADRENARLRAVREGVRA